MPLSYGYGLGAEPDRVWMSSWDGLEYKLTDMWTVPTRHVRGYRRCVNVQRVSAHDDHESSGGDECAKLHV